MDSPTDKESALLREYGSWIVFIFVITNLLLLYLNMVIIHNNYGITKMVDLFWIILGISGLLGTNYLIYHLIYVDKRWTNFLD